MAAKPEPLDHPSRILLSLTDASRSLPNTNEMRTLSQSDVGSDEGGSGDRGGEDDMGRSDSDSNLSGNSWSGRDEEGWQEAREAGFEHGAESMSRSETPNQ